MKKIIVTDPCYLMSSEDWAEAILERGVVTKLREITKDEKAVAGPTQVGDWSNEMQSLDDDCIVVRPAFTADSGMVCVTEYTQALEQYILDHGITLPKMPSIARLKVPENAFYELNYLKKGTEIKIWQGDSPTLLAQSLEVK